MIDGTWLGVAAVAFGAQLAVLPGEKVQFIVAGLSTRYDPLLVVAAAGAAFAGWTAVEVVVGSAVVRLLPGSYLDVLTAGMFAVFAVLLVRSAPAAGAEPAVPADGNETAGDVDETATSGADTATGGSAAAANGDDASHAETDGGAFGAAGELDVHVPGTDWTVPNRLGGFLPIFVMMAVGEFGDKTQIVTITLASQYPASPAAIWTGEMLAIVPVSLANALFFSRFSRQFDLRKAHLVGAGMFAFFAVDTLLGVTVGVSVWEEAVDALAGVFSG